MTEIVCQHSWRGEICVRCGCRMLSYLRWLTDRCNNNAAALATERAAREQLTFERNQYREESIRKHGALEQAERERDSLTSELAAEHERANTALAFLERLRDTPPARRNAWLQALRSEVTTWLASHPAPVAAPCAGCAEARDLLAR